MKVYTMTMEILTPVHVGTGEELDALSYVLQKQDKDAYIYLVDSGRWFADHAHEPDVANALKNYSYLELRTILSRAKDIAAYAEAKIPVISQELVKFYNEAMNNRRRENELRINLLPRNPVGMFAYIPGSSIKGAIRTAVGSFLARQVKSEAEQRCSPQERQRKSCFDSYNRAIFGKVQFDAFKHLKVSDAIVPEDKTEIVQPVERAKNPDKRSTPKGYIEAVKSLAGEGQVILRNRLSIGDFADQYHKDCQRKLPPFSLKELILALNQFYKQKFQDEITSFYNLPHLRYVNAALQPVLERINNMQSNQALLRVGHFCHVESVTWDGVRKPQGKMIRGRRVYGTTRTLAEDRYPFGWILLTFEDDYRPEDDLPVFVKPETENQGESTQEVNAAVSSEPEPEINLLEQKLETLRQKLDALPANQRAGSLPNIAREIMADEDAEFKEQARQIIMDFVQKTGLKKSVKKKKWYQEFVNSEA